MTNPPFTLATCYADPDYNDTNDYLGYAVEIETDRYRFGTLVHFHILERFAADHAPKDLEYFESIRRNISGIGPKYQVMRRMWEEEGYDISILVYAWLDNNLDIEAEIEHMKKKGNRALMDKTDPDYEATISKEMAETLQKMNEAMADWSDSKRLADGESQRMEKFQDALLAEATRLALETWPHMTEGEPEKIVEMGDILVTHIVRMTGDLEELGSKAD